MSPFSTLRRQFRASGVAHRGPLHVTAIMIAFACGCSDTYDTDTFQNPLGPELLDDTAPAPSTKDPSLDFTGRYGVENNSEKRFRFDVMPYRDDDERQRAERLFPSHAAFLASRQQDGVATFPSVQTIGTYVKQLDDTIYAGVERTVQDGLAPTVEPKRLILRGALEYLSSHRSSSGDEAIAMVAAALELGGDTPTVPPELATSVASVKSEFLATPARAKPIGFYTWSEDLSRIWKQDRLLQVALPTGESSCALAAAIASDPARRQAYEKLVALYGKMTNPVKSSLLDRLDGAAAGTCAAGTRAAFLGVSQTSEGELYEKLYPNGVPATADLMADLIKAIREGSVDLAPTADDGWYQHQLYALETLLVTDKSEERAKIGFTARYKKRLQEAFKTMLVQHRETHVKQTGAVVASAPPPPPPTPHFRLEPLATVYVRHARSYVFLERALEATIGGPALDAAMAVDAKGASTESLRKRIARARDLFYGLYVESAQDIGMKFALNTAGDPAFEASNALATAADAWVRGLDKDELAASDVRVIIPIAAVGPGLARYWAVIGVRATVAGYSYIEGSDMSPPPPDKMAEVWLPTEQFLEVTSSDVPLARDEFRALCDEKKTAEAIKAALEAR
jgi:hypothetical protein